MTTEAYRGLGLTVGLCLVDVSKFFASIQLHCLLELAIPTPVASFDQPAALARKPPIAVHDEGDVPRRWASPHDRASRALPPAQLGPTIIEAPVSALRRSALAHLQYCQSAHSEG